MLILDYIYNCASLQSCEAREAAVHRVEMTFGTLGAADPPNSRTLNAVGVILVSPGTMVMIGRDLLATGRFSYDGRKRRFVMSY
jgi:hypothetical protein